MLSAAMAARFASIRLLSLDLDGVLTDGGVYYTDQGDAMRKYHIRDGMGIELLMATGMPVSVITASSAANIRQRMEKLKIPHFQLGVRDKLPALEAVCRSLGIGLDQVAHVADDVNDLPVLRAVGLPIAVADAVAEVKAVAAFVTAYPGGHGAVRQVCDILRARAER